MERYLIQKVETLCVAVASLQKSNEAIMSRLIQTTKPAEKPMGLPVSTWKQFIDVDQSLSSASRFDSMVIFITISLHFTYIEKT